MPVGLSHLLGVALIAGFIGGAAAVERKAALQLMLSRPLVLGTVLGWALGDTEGGLSLAIPLELLFLGGVNLGGSLPHNETLLAGALVSVAVPAGIATGTGVDGPLAAVATAALFPLAWFGRRFERASEVRNGELAEEAVRRARSNDPDAARVNLYGLLLPFGATAGICALATLVAPVLAQIRLDSPPRLQLALEGGWHALWAVAAATAIRAIRAPRAPAIAGVAAAIAIAFGLLFKAVP